MESQQTTTTRPTTCTCGNYRVVCDLGHGYTSKVKLVTDTLSGKQFAMKMLKEGIKQPIQRELEVLTKLTHRHIVQLHEYLQDREYNCRHSTKPRQITAMILELCEGGELIDILAHTERLSEPIVRYYFHQLVDALDFLHKSGYSHRDLKPDNLLLSKDFDLKLADFGFSTPIAGPTPSGLLLTPLGTPGYMAPEIRQGMPYSGTCIDIFSLGVILFVMFAGSAPFNRAEPTDPHYSLIIKRKNDFFWFAHSKLRGSQSFFPDSFKDLVNKLIDFDSTQRLTLDAIKVHPWYLGELPTKEAVIADMKARLEVITAKKEADRARKEAEALKKRQPLLKPSSGGSDPPSTKCARETLRTAIAELISVFPTVEAHRTIEDYDKTINELVPISLRTADYFCSESVPDALLALVYVLNDQQYENIKINKDYYKVKAEIDLDDARMRISCQIFRNDDKTCYIIFKRSRGSCSQFNDAVRVIQQRLDKVSQGIIR